ncbi:unnamed protein product [Echinostoma caproni]|uniref:Transposase n=1 Tax=Echinostoma caproni TaxID=27848 RepID=A0A183B4F0_9TREM|nr:unnamed protein product [Echinostoma caproni]
MRKYRLIRADQFKWHHNWNLFIEPLTECLAYPDTREQSVPQINKRLNGENSRTSTTRFIPGMFAIRVELAGTEVCRQSISLVDLLCQQHRGVQQWTVWNNLPIQLDSLIQLLLDTYYTIR